MVEDGSGAIFLVVFSDGESEMNMGSVMIHPSTEFKGFQLFLSQKIGISQNQITVYLVDHCNKSAKSHMEGRRRIPITGKTNFAVIAKETDCFFLVVLKRSRRSSRRSKPKHGGFEFGHELAPMPEKYLLLRRNQPDLNNPHVYNQIKALEFEDYSERFRNLQIQRDNYARIMMNSDAISTLSSDLNSFPVTEDVFRVSSMTADKQPFCEECANASMKGRTAPFHSCVFDAVVVGSRSTAGPIARPRKAVHYY